MAVPAYVALQVQSQRPCVCPRSWGVTVGRFEQGETDEGGVGGDL